MKQYYTSLSTLAEDGEKKVSLFFSDREAMQAASFWLTPSQAKLLASAIVNAADADVMPNEKDRTVLEFTVHDKWDEEE